MLKKILLLLISISAMTVFAERTIYITRHGQIGAHAAKAFNGEPALTELGQQQARQLAEYLNRFLLALPEDERNVFVCRYWRCDDIASIAKQFSFSEGKVKMMLFRTRNKLRHFLEKEGIFV